MLTLTVLKFLMFLVPFAFGTWTTPRTWVPGELVTAGMMNTHVRDNLNALRSEHFSVQRFRGLILRTSPNNETFDMVTLQHAEEIVMDDGTRLGPWDQMDAHIGVSGAGGLDTGAAANDKWYEIYAIAKDDGTKNVLLHLATAYATVATGGVTGAASSPLRNASARTKLAQGFQVTSAGSFTHVDIFLTRVGSPTGTVHLTVESDSGGSPSAVLATSDKLAVPYIPSSTATLLRFPFRTPPTLATGTQYHLVLQGDFSISGSNYVQWLGDTSNSYASGVAKAFDGAAWSTGGVSGSIVDFALTGFVTAGTSVTMPATYTKKAKLGYVYRTASILQKFIQHDNDVVRLASSLSLVIASGQTNTSPLSFSAAALLPPCPVIARCKAFANAAAIVSIGGVPDGFVDQSVASLLDRNGGVDQIHCPVSSTVFGSSGSGTATELQLLYASTNTGTYSVEVAGFRFLY